jgi:hypothetical protein
MTPDEIHVFHSHGTRTAKLATSGPGAQLHVMRVWFVLDGEELVFTTWATHSRAGTSAEIRSRR